jgi:two-component system, NtrC family, sensor kinase
MHAGAELALGSRQDRDEIGPIYMIRTRWLVALTIATVAVIGGLVYRDETSRSEAALDDLGEQKAVVARAANLALSDIGARGPSMLVALQRPGNIVVWIQKPGELLTLDGRRLASPELAAAVGRGDQVVRIAPADAPSLGLPERTAMVGIAMSSDGSGIAVASSAERQRDRDRAGRFRVLLSMVLAAFVMSAFAWFVWRKQRSEAQLERELAVAETARGRDAELDRLNRAATMAAVGSGVAHELSTPLGVIVGRAEQLMARVQGDERAVKNAQAILDQAEHINQVVRGLLGLARGAPIALQSVDARSLVRDAAALVEHRFTRANVHLVPVVGAMLPELRCEPLLFKHALVNLMLNACDASPARSTVRIDVHADAAAMAFVVTDEGDGITAQNAARALEPFFTTKPAGQGTGLGLAIANEIAKTHRGTLDIASTPPRGTRACIRIPIEASAV